MLQAVADLPRDPMDGPGESQEAFRRRAWIQQPNSPRVLLVKHDTPLAAPHVVALVEDLAADGRGVIIVREKRGRLRSRSPGRRGADGAWPLPSDEEERFLAENRALLTAAQRGDPTRMAHARAARSSDQAQVDAAIIRAYRESRLPERNRAAPIAQALGLKVNRVRGAIARWKKKSNATD